MFEFLLLIHILFAALWFGGAVFLMVIAHMAYIKGRDELITICKLGGSSAAFFGAISGFTLISGILMMVLANPGYSWGAPFISIGFTVFFVCSFLEARLLRPAFSALGASVANEDTAKIGKDRMKVLLYGASNIALIAIAIVCMVYKV